MVILSTKDEWLFADFVINIILLVSEWTTKFTVVTKEDEKSDNLFIFQTFLDFFEIYLTIEISFDAS